MSDDWRERWRSWLDHDNFAHPNSPAGGSGTGFSRRPLFTGYTWSPLPDPESPAGRLVHWQTALWRAEQRERDEIARRLEELESSLAKQSDKLRETIPNDYLRTLYDRQVGRTKGTYGFAKSLIGTGVDTALLLQKLTNPVGWFDPDLHRKLRQGYSFGRAGGKSYLVWEFGTLQEKKQLLEHCGALAECVYEEAKKSIRQQWAEAQRTGKQQELIEKWKTRILLEVGTLVIGTGELKAAGSAAASVETAIELRTGRVSESALEASVRAGEGAFQTTQNAEGLRNATQIERTVESNAGHKYAEQVLESGTGSAFAGHGELRYGSGTFVVPGGTKITLPTNGIAIQDRTGQLMEAGDWDGLADAARSDPEVANDITGMATYLPGAEIPNYTLKAPVGCTIYGNSSTVENATLLSGLLRPDMGYLQWAACTVPR